MSICIHCGQDHDVTLRVCPKTGKAISAMAQKTLFGVPPGFIPATPGHASAPGKGVPPAVVALPPPRPQPRGNPPNALALGKTTFGAPPLPRPPAPIAPPARLPTEEEARQDPDLVISLDSTPLPSRQSAATSAGRSDSPLAPAASEPPVDLPNVEIPALASKGEDPAAQSESPTDLPPAGKGKRLVLPQSQENPSFRKTKSAKIGSFSDRLAADTGSMLDLFRWASGAYLRKPKPFFLLAAMLVLPVSVLESCLLAAVARGPDPSVFAAGGTTVDFSARKAALAARIQTSQARGEMDKQAVAELAALTAVETTQVPIVEGQTIQGRGWLREGLALVIQGLLIFGLALPIACGALAIATADQQGGAALPEMGDIWPILLARGELFLISLFPAALLVAAGNALFILPGLVLCALFIFVPHVVLFEKRGGRTALLRSIELVRNDAVRVALAFLTFALLGFAAATLTELVLPTSGSRAVIFLHFIISDLVTVAILPVPAMMLARIYLDLRARTGDSPDHLSRAARA